MLAEQTGTDPAIFYLHGLDLVAQSDGATTEYFAYDGLGSVRQVVDEAGSGLYQILKRLAERAGTSRLSRTCWGTRRSTSRSSTICVSTSKPSAASTGCTRRRQVVD